MISQFFTITQPHFDLSQVACFATSAAIKKYFSYCFHSDSEKVFILILLEINNDSYSKKFIYFKRI